ncbi:Lactate/malate dehydrogenase [Pyrolobus fumarii 1A]|uniref:Malate dehydrogenase n=1 Tax=Pyrolobus fumarii (strain DSM 11204 / 1A) TaxID=694429 RepID=G0EHD0_PYRF1|nr:NAD-binding protein [Pyrolobus fumarii]AEM38505.1 Lactate/malate dehydrogenase [Pyrolobus fumarii 1A]
MARLKIAVVGVGRLGQAVAFRVLQEPYVKELILVDIREDFVQGIAEEFRHYVAIASMHDVEVEAVSDASEVAGADIVIVTAGVPRKPGMSRRDLAGQNAKIMKTIAEAMSPRNPNAVFLIATNPVDAMTMVFKRYARVEKVYGFGTMLDTARFRSILARELGVEPSRVTGFFVGEHGESGFVAWSTVYVDGIHVDKWVKRKGKLLDKQAVEQKVHRVAAEVIAATGATMWGPAGAFIKVIRGFAIPEDHLLAFGVEMKFPEVEEPVILSVPTMVTRGYVKPLLELLNEEERKKLVESAKSILNVYKQALTALEEQKES